MLRGLCTQILRDERQHVRFHVERFTLMHAGRSRFTRGVRNALWRGFFTGTLLAVWLKHRRAFRLGGYSFGRFWHEAWKGFRSAARGVAIYMLNPTRNGSAGSRINVASAVT